MTREPHIVHETINEFAQKMNRAALSMQSDSIDERPCTVEKTSEEKPESKKPIFMPLIKACVGLLMISVTLALIALLPVVVWWLASLLV